jgi:lipopolysaccharide transport system ATP-binding protein
MKSRFDDILAFADIGDFVNQPVKTYSSGMMVRLAFAVSVNVNPEILIIDEALSVGDAAFQFKCLQRLDRLKKSGTSLLFVSHSMEMVKNFCDRAVYLKQGRQHHMASPEEIAELYLMDIRDERNRNLSPHLSVNKKPVSSEDACSSFGTCQGSIVSATFEDKRHSAILFFGEELSGHVEVEYDSSVQKPCLVMIIQDVKGLNIGGSAVLLPSQEMEGCRRIRLRFQFKVMFFFGTFFITLRLEDRRTKEINFLVEKQVGVLSFEVMRTGKEITVGTVDLGVKWLSFNE